MPLPTTLARINRVLINPVVRRFAGRIAPLAIVVHRGRTSGKQYRTPILAFPAGDGFVIALTYGRNTDWERNVLDSGGCELVYRNTLHALTAPHFIRKDEAETVLPLPIRVALRLIGVDSFLRLDQAGHERVAEENEMHSAGRVIHG